MSIPQTAHGSIPARFTNILNFRDVGQTINSISISPVRTPQLKTGLLFRSARPDAATVSDRNLLTSTFKIKTIIDLRSKSEHINAAKKHSDAAAIAQPAAVPSSNDVVASPLKMPGITYAEVNLNGKGFERALLWKLSWSSMAKLISLMTLGYRTEAIAILGREVMHERGLIGLGIDTLEYSGREIKDVFDVLADQSQYPVLIHCTQGKDRTGLIVLLVLMLCGANVKAMSEDYVMSERELEPEQEERLKEIKSIGLDENFAGCPRGFVEKVADRVNEHYGGIESYLKSIEVDAAAQKRVREIMLEDKI